MTRFGSALQKMLANPVLVPAYASPEVWLLALIAMWAEIRVVVAVLRRLGLDVAGLDSPLTVVQIVTWIPFLVAFDAVSHDSESPELWLVGLEALVILVEIPLILVAARGWFLSQPLPCSRMTWLHGLLASLAGNLASIAISLGVPFLLIMASR